MPAEHSGIKLLATMLFMKKKSGIERKKFETFKVLFYQSKNPYFFINKSILITYLIL